MLIQEFKQLIQQSHEIVFFGGAGVSTESDIPDFRSASGLYTTSKNESYPPEYMLSRSCFINDTESFYEYYKSHMIVTHAKPNQAHLALAHLEKIGKLKAVVTQNIDGLHQMAGSKNVLELHGSIYRNYCMQCHQFYDLTAIIESDAIPRCSKCGNIIKPDVVLYEEGLNMDVVNRAIQHIQRANLLIVGGTSLKVYPAAGLLDYFKGDHLVLINRDATPYDRLATLNFNESIGHVLSKAIL